MNVLKILKPIGNGVIKHLPELLVGTGLAGMVAAGIFAVRATPKAERKLETLIAEREEAYDKGEADTNEITKTEKAKCMAPYYIPAGAMFVLSSGLIIAALVVSTKRYSAMAALYSMSAETIALYQKKIEEFEGAEKAKLINSEINEQVESKNRHGKKKINKRFDSTHRWSKEEAVGIIPGTGPDLIYDMFTGRVFWGSKDEVERAFVRTKADAVADIDGSYSINDFYTNLDLDSVESGDLMFDSERGRVNDIVWSTYSPNDKVLAWAFSFKFKPTEYDYR